MSALRPVIGAERRVARHVLLIGVALSLRCARLYDWGRSLRHRRNEKGGGRVAWFQPGSGRHYWRCGVVFILAALTCCTAPSTAPGPDPVAVKRPVAQPIAAVLAAGDSSIPAFDNAIEYLRDLLDQRGLAGSSARLLSARRQRPADEELSALETLEARLEALKPSAGGGWCGFFYL